MLELNMDDVLAVLQSVAPQLAVIGVAFLAAILVTVFTGAKRIAGEGKRKLTHALTWIVAVAVALASVNSMLMGPLKNIVTSATAEKLSLSAETIEATNKLAVDIEEEGITLLKNDNGTLPLAKGNVNVFGWASTNPIYGGTGSGSLSDAYDTVSLLDGLNNAGFTTNQELSDFYTSYATERGKISVTAADWTLSEPPAANYSQELIDIAKAYSDTAIVVIGRVGGEGLDLPTDMKADDVIYNNNSAEYDDFEAGQHYLELNRTEHDMLDLVCANFENVVVVYNGANAFEMGFVNDYPQISSVVWAPHPGQAGFTALGTVLSGETNPSGKTSDTFLYDLTQAPSWNNFGDFAYDNVEEFQVESARGTRSPRFVNYTEGIYVGYRFYETASDEGLIDYDSTVQFPFGYGLSYTTFSQSMGAVTYANGTVSFDVTVTNTGSVAGKDVVEVYSNPPYTNGGIEKATANLVTYEKTKLLEPGESQTISISFDDDDLASYDYQNAKAYVLEAGDYTVSINADSHTEYASTVVSVAETNAYNTADNTHNGDEVVATNVFDDANGDLVYLSRANGFANYAEATAAPTNYGMADEYKSTYYNNGNYDPTQFDNASDEMPTTGANNGVRLYDLRGVDYDDAKWNDLLDELTVDDMNNLIANGGYSNAAVDSIGKIRLSDVDGPAALKDNFTGVSSIGLPCNVAMACTWNKNLARQFGETIGDMAHELQVSGWYAPSINIHRSAFGGRNFEYFSEDPVLTGAQAAQEMLGAADRGVYSFTKHFALNEQETQRNGQLCTWANEQSIREIYLRAFEIVVKSDNDAQAIMGSFNYIGNTYSSAHLGLNQTVLRDEWGFTGMVETDYFSGPNYMYQNADQLIRGGTDIMLATTETTNYVTDLSATAVQQMRRACHNILYTAVNSWRYADGDPAAVTPTWMSVMYGVDIVAAVVLVGLGVVAFKRSKERA
ncbi:glycoside hydrolase family 3 protein [Paratractidigestivibacter sp.]|uniref:glycoside hydrolase family 3 protein n=1 Tax=Paratractidigestivibacter sp. TaxID=2847316 RepID=UPI002AC9D66A|nr:glycoside hydrolase family 3 C-terminal domain-containing protein [Paratractidigestivibacter sp.]